MKTKLLFLICTLLCYNSLTSQSFLDESNSWAVDFCGINFCTGEFGCHKTEQFHFSGSTTINSKEYKTLRAEDGTSPFPSFFRQEDKKVYAIDIDHSSTEFLMYDFGLEVGESARIGDDNFNRVVRVAAIDSIQLNSGEMRKRMEMVDSANSTIRIYWVEGIGSDSSPLDTRFMILSLDLIYELNCFLINSEVQFSLKDCLLSTSVDETANTPSLTVFPSPNFNGALNFTSDQFNEINHIEIYGMSGQRILLINEIHNNEIDINNLVSGMYFLKIGYSNNTYEVAKFVKN